MCSMILRNLVFPPLRTSHRSNHNPNPNAPTAKSLATHKRKSHNTESLLCEWPGCRSAMTGQDAFDTHIRQIHERQMWICTVRICHQRFVTEAEAIGHLEKCILVVTTTPLVSWTSGRTFNLAELRSMRETAIEIWKMKCRSEDEEQRQVAMLYAAYHSPAARLYFSKRGVLNQDVDAKPDHCSTVERLYRKSGTDEQRSKHRYTVRVGKDRVDNVFCWWIIFDFDVAGVKKMETAMLANNAEAPAALSTTQTEAE